MPQQCCPLPRTPLCGVCVCGARALCIRKLWHFAHFLSTVKTCQDMSSFLTHSSFPSSSPVTAFCVISCRRRRHKVLPAHTHIALQLFCISACGNLRQKWLHFTFFSFPSLLATFNTPNGSNTRSQLGLVIHTKRHELVVVTVVVAVVAVTVVAVVSVAVVAADFLLACMRLVCNLIATRLCLGL